MNCKKTIPMAAMVLSFFMSAALLHAQDVESLEYPRLNELKMPKIVRETLDNGMRLYLVQDRSLPIFNLSARINCGSFLEPEDKIGLASICGTVLRTGGTTKFGGDQIDELLEGVGASVETSIGMLSGNASINSLSEYTDMSLDILAQVLRYPLFDEDKIELAKVSARSGISRRNDNARSLGFREFNRIIYGPNSVYARQMEYTTVDNISRDDLIEFHATYFKPENIQIAIWGDFDKADLIASIRDRFGDWKRGNTPVPPPPKVDYQFSQRVSYIDPPSDVTQSGVYIGHIGGLVTDLDYADRIVMNNVLGGGFGNRMLNAVRSREGLAYSAFGQYTSHISYPGVFINYVGTKSETTGKAVKEAIKVIQSMLDEPPTDEEMRKAKESYLNSFVFQFDTKSEIVNRFMNYEFFGLPEDFLFELKEKIENVTVDDVVAAAHKNLRPDALQIMVVGKSKDFDIPLADLGYGSVTGIDITIPSAEGPRELAITTENLTKGKSVLDKAVSAHGGVANFKKIHSVSAKGTYTLVNAGREMGLPFEEKRLLPENSRLVLQVPGGNIYQINTGRGGWKTDRATGQIVAKSEEDIRDDRKEQARYTISIFQSSDAPDYRAVYDGTGRVNDVDVEFVAIVAADDDMICRYGFNTETGEMVCKYFVTDTPQGEGTVEEIYRDFKQIEGVTIPMSSVRNVGGNKIAAIEYSEYEINSTVDEALFQKPE